MFVSISFLIMFFDVNYSLFSEEEIFLVFYLGGLKAPVELEIRRVGASPAMVAYHWIITLVYSSIIIYRQQKTT